MPKKVDADVCHLCGHRWHGLECGILSMPGTQIDPCTCPTSFVDKYKEST